MYECVYKYENQITKIGLNHRTACDIYRLARLHCPVLFLSNSVLFLLLRFFSETNLFEVDGGRHEWAIAQMVV